jgi:thioredoxin 1
VPTDLLIRILWTVLIAGLLLGAYWLVNRVILARARGKRLGLENLQPGLPAVLYFTTPDCIPCKTVQRPALIRLQQVMGEALQLIEVDAALQPELADYWGVLSVPTTFIIDAHGIARGVNHGIASAEKLQAQIEQVSGNKAAFSFLEKVLLRFQDKRNYS